MTDSVRKAGDADLERLQRVERAAAQLFPAGRIPDPDEVTSLEELAEARREGLLLVADASGEAVGFALCAEESGRLHLYELAVHPHHGRRGLGRALVQAVIEEANDRGLSGVSLTTFEDLPWNGPFYASLDFRTLSDIELDAILMEILAHERQVGLTRRIAMFRPGGSR